MNRSEVGRPIEILLVEDNPGDAELTAEALRHGKVYNQMHVVEDGEAALAFLRHHEQYANVPRPDVILLDLNLPRKDGREVLAEIKADEGLKADPGNYPDHLRGGRRHSSGLRSRGQLLHHQTGGPGPVHQGGESDRRFLVHGGETTAHPVAPSRDEPRQEPGFLR